MSSKAVERAAEFDLAQLGDTYEIVGELAGRPAARTYIATRREDGLGVFVVVSGTPPGDEGNAISHLAADTNRLATLSHRNLLRVLEGKWVGPDAFAVVHERTQARPLDELIAHERLSHPRIASILRDLNSLLVWARSQKIINRALLPHTVHVEPGSDRVLASFAAAPLPLTEMPGAESDAKTIATLAKKMLVPEWTIGDATSLEALSPDLPKKVVEQTEALLAQAPQGQDEAIDVPAYISLIAVSDALKQGEEETQRCNIALADQQRTAAEQLAAERTQHDAQIAAEREQHDREMKDQRAAFEKEREEYQRATAKEREEYSQNVDKEREAFQRAIARDREENEKRLANERDEHAKLMAKERKEAEKTRQQLAKERLRLAEERERFAAERKRFAEQRAAIEEAAKNYAQTQELAALTPTVPDLEEEPEPASASSTVLEREVPIDRPREVWTSAVVEERPPDVDVAPIVAAAESNAEEVAPPPSPPAPSIDVSDAGERADATLLPAPMHFPQLPDRLKKPVGVAAVVLVLAASAFALSRGRSANVADTSRRPSAVIVDSAAGGVSTALPTAPVSADSTDSTAVLSVADSTALVAASDSVARARRRRERERERERARRDSMASFTVDSVHQGRVDTIRVRPDTAGQPLVPVSNLVTPGRDSAPKPEAKPDSVVKPKPDSTPRRDTTASPKPDSSVKRDTLSMGRRS